jgi:hypothetical protein
MRKRRGDTEGRREDGGLNRRERGGRRKGRGEDAEDAESAEDMEERKVCSGGAAGGHWIPCPPDTAVNHQRDLTLV